ncbi:SigE family RNA polymerase sigma factor [Amycolatopsis mediterranei]|uniref:SigE family RNA polymerase sigma factor n=1 Tax=Amycolatopsis mediterranei TaxID=33910 RepID=UPI003316B5D7
MISRSRPSTGPGSPWDGEFARYFGERAHSLRSTAFLLCGDWHQAEDLTQAALLKIYLAWPRLSRHDALDAYARKVVLRTFLAEHRRSRWKRERLTDTPPELPAEPASDQDMLVRQALAVLAPKQRAVLVLRYFEDLSVEETAQALGCSTGTVKSQGRAVSRSRCNTAAGGGWC